MAKRAINSISLMSSLKDIIDRDSEEGILIDEIIFEETAAVERFIQEAKNARREIEKNRSQTV